LPDYATSPLYDEAERVALEYADGMTISGREVDDALFARLRGFYDDEAPGGIDRDHRLGECLQQVQPRAADPVSGAVEASLTELMPVTGEAEGTIEVA
jgi:hypothetical protein